MFCSGFGPYGFNSSSYIGSGWMFLAMGFRLLIFIALIVLAVKLYNKYTRNSNAPIKILDEKFANGDITEEEYLKRRTILSQKN